MGENEIEVLLGFPDSWTYVWFSFSLFSFIWFLLKTFLQWIECRLRSVVSGGDYVDRFFSPNSVCFVLLGRKPFL